MKEDEAEKKVNEISRDIERVIQNPIALETFRSIVSHIFILYNIINDAIGIIVELITWVLMREHNLTGMLDECENAALCLYVYRNILGIMKVGSNF
ncbi:MAG: hypothetical protein QXO15_12355 [Nitrososphaerota archaeon]